MPNRISGTPLDNVHSWLLTNESGKNKKIQLTLDVVSVKKLVKKAKNTCRNSKISLYKNFKLILGQNVIEQTYPKITFSLQKSAI